MKIKNIAEAEHLFELKNQIELKISNATDFIPYQITIKNEINDTARGSIINFKMHTADWITEDPTELHKVQELMENLQNHIIKLYKTELQTINAKIEEL